jgi:hypothetical protein
MWTLFLMKKIKTFNQMNWWNILYMTFENQHLRYKHNYFLHWCSKIKNIIKFIMNVKLFKSLKTTCLYYQYEEWSKTNDIIQNLRHDEHLTISLFKHN